MALLVKVDGTRETVEGEGDNGKLTYDQLKKAIGGGYLELVSCDPAMTEGHVAFYCDEEGKLKHFLPNEKATMWSTYTAPNDVVCGDVIFLKPEELD
ncbi:MAG: hypothetical protein CMK74_14795 [Pseudomonadales bacterium]|nr:hypothetical protein [Pseudomonadales bacterium]|tara:strand:+ start:957 stop:1247 length:291 start_codon:yes stop_codon:yes gene_type:complete